MFRSTHAEIRPVLDHSTWRGGHRASPYPPRGGRFGGGPSGGRYGSGYERQHRGGRGGGTRGGRGVDHHSYGDGYGGQYYMDNGSYQGGGYQAPPPEQSGIIHRVQSEE